MGRADGPPLASGWGVALGPAHPSAELRPRLRPDVRGAAAGLGRRAGRRPLRRADGRVDAHRGALHGARPAMGGTRLKAYDSPDEALADVLRLSRAMTMKQAAAGLDFGGREGGARGPRGAAAGFGRAARAAAAVRRPGRLAGRHLRDRGRHEHRARPTWTWWASAPRTCSAARAAHGGSGELGGRHRARGVPRRSGPACVTRSATATSPGAGCSSRAWARSGPARRAAARGRGRARGGRPRRASARLALARALGRRGRCPAITCSTPSATCSRRARPAACSRPSRSRCCGAGSWPAPRTTSSRPSWDADRLRDRGHPVRARLRDQRRRGDPPGGLRDGSAGTRRR